MKTCPQFTSQADVTSKTGWDSSNGDHTKDVICITFVNSRKKPPRQERRRSPKKDPSQPVALNRFLELRTVNLEWLIPVRIRGNHAAIAHNDTEWQMTAEIDADGVPQAAAAAPMRMCAAGMSQVQYPFLACPSGSSQKLPARNFRFF